MFALKGLVYLPTFYTCNQWPTSTVFNRQAHVKTYVLFKTTLTVDYSYKIFSCLWFTMVKKDGFYKEIYSDK